MERQYSVLSLFSGAGGLDIGFAQAGFIHTECVEIDAHSVATLALNRPDWNVYCGDVRGYTPPKNSIDVLIGGPPCQGFSLGGKRDAGDERNELFLQMVRIAKEVKPRVIVIENVLNLRTMYAPWSGRNFAEEIALQFTTIGYSVLFDTFKLCHFGVPQTRRRFIFIAVLGSFPVGYQLPTPEPEATTIRNFLFDLANNDHIVLPNHVPEWGFTSQVHTNLNLPNAEIAGNAEILPIRISRTGSDGHPIRSFDQPFPAVDTATVWGWGKGTLHAERKEKDRLTGKHVRNPEANVKLWRITADQMRIFTHREYARLQTFPDNWTFKGENKRDIHKQIGNAVPVEFAKRIALNVREMLNALDARQLFTPKVQASKQLSLAL